VSGVSIPPPFLEPGALLLLLDSLFYGRTAWLGLFPLFGAQQSLTNDLGQLGSGILPVLLSSKTGNSKLGFRNSF
jgi:hypothetical protein